MGSSQLIVWAIYQRPKDYPQGFVVRPWSTVDGQILGGKVQYAETLSEARSKVPPNLVRLPPLPGEDPVILESWI